jgi:RNA-directed DNA polymerase
MPTRTLDQIRMDAMMVSDCKEIGDVQNKMKISSYDLQLYCLHPKYYSFSVRKSSGGTREIETPTAPLKELQRRLNYYLQAFYYVHQPSSSYGYIISARNRKNTKNIVNNAERHLGNKYMMQMDFEDFFHQIKTKNIFELFTNKTLSFTQKTAYSLAKVCTYNDHLPMGAPTSPVLSNLYTIDLDKSLENWAGINGIVYSRFVDDLTFSSNDKEITKQHCSEVQDICTKYHLALNEKKTKFSGPNDLKTVTGLLLNKTVDIPCEFYINLDKDLKRLKNIYEASLITSHLEDNKLLTKFKQVVQGQINFIGMVETYGSPVYKDYLNRYHQSLEADEELFTMRWTHFSYL